jgi:ankyrin repeat protein
VTSSWTSLADYSLGSFIPAEDLTAVTNPSDVTADDEREGRAFCAALFAGDVAGVRAVLESSAFVRRHINEPGFDFGQRAAHVAATNTAMLGLLLEFGADVNLRSDWANGPFTVLDNADETSARFLIERGAVLTPHVAARLGWLDELRRLIDADPLRVQERGGDGQQPLHQAKTVAVAEYLLDRGAEIDARCIDHRSTPSQYALADRPDVCRYLLSRGAAPDIYMAARLGDHALAERLLAADPTVAGARVNEAGYAPVPPGHIYCWTLGFGVSPAAVSLKYGHRDVYDALWRHSPPKVRLLDAALRGDESGAREALRQDPSLTRSLTPDDHAQLALAIFHGRFEGAGLMLGLGFDPKAGGVDGGSALHAAAWMGHVELVERLIARGDIGIDSRDPKHQSTPLGWAAFGSVHRCAKDGDYVGVIDRLIAAGADVRLPGNGDGDTYPAMAEGNAAVQGALRRYLSES